ncbi:hypothetical protein [Streptomyces aureus]|uniref:hypothetical protein n=1 Tax=Streptomyces aureus TaxID=193461 RepID=UPI0036A2ACE3
MARRTVHSSAGPSRTPATGRTALEAPATGRTALGAPAASRTLRTTLVTAALALALVAALAGCGDSGELRGAGATPTAVGPTRLWPLLPPASTPAVDYGEADTETVKGVTAPGDDVRALDPVAVVRAEVAAHPDEYRGPHAAYAETARLLADCGQPGARGARCPVLRAYYRDLTGDGKADMVLGIRFPAHQLAVRVYTFIGHRLVQVMGTADSVLSVELAGREVIIRSPSTLPGYEFRTVWSWDPHQNAMLATRDEILRVGPPASPTAPGSPAPTPPPSARGTSPGPAPPPPPSPSAHRTSPTTSRSARGAPPTTYRSARRASPAPSPALSPSASTS